MRQKLFHKISWSVGWKEILKNILQLKIPVVGAKRIRGIKSFV